jgi:signal transduction histidine kinase
LADRDNVAVPEPDRLRALVAAGVAVASELSIDAVLQKIVEAAAELTGARYAALGVIDGSGRGLEKFIVTGIDAETHAAIGDLPRGRGILGVLVREPAALRLHDLNADPRAVGLPPNHPPMKAFLGVPILLRGVAYGNLYLTKEEGGSDFTDADEELTLLLASQAAVSIENARLYESATRWSKQLASLNEISIALASETDLSRVLDLVAVQLRDLVGARLALIALPVRGGDLLVQAASGESADELVGTRLAPESKMGRVLERRRSERVDSLIEDLEVDQDVTRRIEARTGLYVPLIARDRVIGILALHDKLGEDARFSDEDVRLAETFAPRVAIAVDLSERVARDSLRRVVAAQELERQRLARELHDETGQALTSILLGLNGIEDARSEGEVAKAADDVRQLVISTLQDVRQLAVELRPKALDDFGLLPAVERLVEGFGEQTGIKVELAARLGTDRLPSEIETALYRITQEALTNVVKHAQASRVSIVLARRENSVTAVIEDDGRGLEESRDGEEGLGLIGMRERIELLGGKLSLESSRASGTTVAAEVPLS